MIITCCEGTVMAIESLELFNMGPFRLRPGAVDAYKIVLEFDANANLLIGPNNVGKSTILQALISAIASDLDVIKALPRAYANASHDRSIMGFSMPFAELVWTSSVGDYRKLRIFETSDDGYWESASLQIGGKDGLQFADEIDWEELQRDFGYVGYHNPASPQTDPESTTFWSYRVKKGAEDDLNVLRAINLKRGVEEWDRGVFDEIDRVILEITEGFRVEMGVGVFASDPESERQEWREGQNKFATMDGELTFPELSHGTRSVLSWVSQLMLGMAEHYEYYDDWKRRRGIFIIDEIDAHLHPSWQRRVIPTLQRHFPNVQIFASTHSPMMVAGLKKGQVHLLKRDETGRVVWSRNEQDIIGWTADEIYRTFMGIDDPTDELTVQRANRLRELRDKIPRTEVEEEELQNLRKQVNQDLLAGGHLNAQRERYAGLMEKFLRSRMADLSQDGA